MKDIWWARVVFREFSAHFIEKSDEEIVRDIRASLVALAKLDDSGSSIGAAMVSIAKSRLQGAAVRAAQANGRKGGRPRKQQNSEALVSQPKSLPGTACGDAAAVTNNAGTAPAGQFFEVRQALPGAQPLSASGETFEEARTTNAATTPVPVPAHGNAAGGLRNLGSLVGPETGETLGRRLPATTRADARIREDRDESATVRAQTLDGDAATREGAVDCLTPQGERSESATSPSDFQKRPGKSATTSYDVEKSIHEGGSERGADGRTHSVRLSPGAKKTEPRLRYGSAGNVLMTAAEMARLASEFGDVRQITEELSDYLLLHPGKYRSHYAALRNWCRRRIREGRNPDGTKMTQGDRLARHFALREKEILDGNDAEKE